MSGLAHRYEMLVAAGELRRDPDQQRAIDKLTALSAGLEAVPRRGSVLWRSLARKPDPIRGAYLWGGVGRGKSMMMDLFFAFVAIPSKRRVHFHEFMLEIHDRLRSERAKEQGDPILPVAEAIRDGARLLAIDEMVVNNTAFRFIDYQARLRRKIDLAAFASELSRRMEAGA